VTNLEAIPNQRNGFQIEEMDGETLLYQHQLKKMIYLNESAALIWHLCDGRRSVADIIDVLTDSYPDTKDAVREDAMEAIDSLILEGALYVGAADLRPPST
jgi:Coenzyme PQQ synthesis protein D (PqqD)